MHSKVELFDLVDANGTIVRYAVPKEHIGNFAYLYRQVVLGCIFNDINELLVQKRALQKKVEPGKLDQVCGFIDAGETPLQAVKREAIEETGVQLSNVQLVNHKINEYGVYEYIFVATTTDYPVVSDPSEVEWAKFISLRELKEKNTSQEWKFVRNFFDNTQLVIDWLAANNVQLL